MVLLTSIFPESFTLEERSKNFDYYEAITTHDSSLSAATYAIEAARLKKIEKKAYELFKYGISVDFGPAMHTSNAGIHAGSLAAIWQMIVFGFGGLTWSNNKVSLNPNLPKNWTSLKYRAMYQGVTFEVHVTQDKLKIKTLSAHKELKLMINNKEEIITNISKEFSL